MFDVAQHFLLFDTEHAEEPPSTRSINSCCTRETCRQLYEQGVRVLLCGAASRVWREHLAELGIEVHHGLAGEVLAIKQAFCRDRQAGITCFGMPGLGRRGGRGGRRQRRHLVCHFDSLIKESENVTF